jgi:hypothetical protein
MVSIDLPLEQGEALLAASVRFKFNEDERPGPYFGSPQLAGALVRIRDAVVRASESDGQQGRAWADWSKRGYEREVVVAHASTLSAWDRWDDDGRIQFLRSCAAPIEVDGADVLAMVDEVNRRRVNA